VLEVTGADKAERRSRGKDDTLDAINAARAALDGKRTSVAKQRDGEIEALRVLRVTRQTAVKARRAALQQLRNTIVAAPDEVRDQTRSLTRMQLIRTCAGWRPDADAAADPVVATRIALKSLARRIIDLNDEIANLDEPIEQLVRELSPKLLDAIGIGVEIAGQLLVTAGDNPERLRSEAGFAMLCGVAPLPASSGKTQRHRLNRGGDRQANRALHLAAITRLRLCPRTRAYATRRKAEGLSKREIIRCLKRYIARETYRLLTTEVST
jgi:transposase